jgi:hypothetical protein
MLKELLGIYKKSKSVSWENMNDLNQFIFSKKQGLPVVLVETRKVLKELRPIRQPLESFFGYGKNPYFWMIPIATPSKKIVGFIIRSFYDKYYMTLFEKDDISPMFGWEDFSNFKLNSPVVLCEGVKDAIFLKQYYPYVLSLNTSEITSLNLEIIKKLTGKIILCYDNDSTGIPSAKSDHRLLTLDNKMSCEIVLPLIKNGDCADYFKACNRSGISDFVYNLKYNIDKLGGSIKYGKV